ncbi:MAG: hypothetical protein ACHQAY_03665 [Hyphomicrobiales bacterium]
MTEKPATTAIVFSCDDAYVFLARGLVLSLAEAGYPDGDTKLILIDIGCGPEALSWMREHGVEIVPFDSALIPQRIMAVIRPVQRAQVVRPWLPELLPRFEHFIWLDCDLWLQNGDVVKVLRAGANAVPDAVMLAPGNSHYNPTFYTDIEGLLNTQRGWYASCYEPDFAKKAAMRLHYSSGVFGMRRASPIWALWRHEVESLYPLVAVRDGRLMHLAEQIALNAVIIRTDLIVRLDPLYNFHCNEGGALRTQASGRVVTNMLLPSREIGVMHLANWSQIRQHYVREKLLYRSGDYLSHAEWASVAR